MRKILITLLTLISLSACSSWLPIHRPDIQQGNIIEAEKIQQLQVGMSQKQVRFLLGNPIFKAALPAERWDYVYHLKSGDGEISRESYSIFFKDNNVSEVRNNRS